MDYVLTALVPILLVLCVLWGNKKVSNSDTFMSKDYTTVLKGACCIIVILVHIPLAYQNKLQDAIGSFAFICVTMFFLMSAYGMSLSKDKKNGYMKHFWRNRLSALLVPQMLINISFCISQYLTTGEYGNFFYINNYIIVLLEYCLWFYLVYIGRNLYSGKVANILLVVGVAISSFVMYFLFDGNEWCYERWGLIWGLLLYLNFSLIKRFVKSNWSKIFIFGLISLILGIAYLKFKTFFFYGEYLLKILLGLVVILFVYILSSQRILGNKAILFLGRISYEVYLSHGLVMIVLKNVMPELSSGIFIVLTVLITILFSAMIHYIGKPIVRYCRAK